ncbi:protein of unknown function [Rhodovastum atsumiense]|nr:protein of unknown function [Rhodovastum atsumiense]
MGGSIPVVGGVRQALAAILALPGNAPAHAPASLIRGAKETLQ